MDALGGTLGPLAGAVNEAATVGTYEEDTASRHFATTASQVPIPAGAIPPPPPPAPTATMQPPLEPSPKDSKSHGTRFHEECHEIDTPSAARLRSSRMFKGKGKEAVRVEKEERKKPLNLLDLPVDILKDIVKEVTHTNDLTSLALCHSALHRLATPHIYSRFDIVWPDTNTHAEPRSGVDALTYGLATLVMAEEIFGEAPNQRRSPGNRFNASGRGRASDMTVRRRRGNHYAQFTRKFSLGNGPPDWVQEYLITKEGGKMLGTLVALAIARMRTLETFIWDMPTGILRDVWLALSSLGDRDDGGPCRLEKVWVRWHDNSSADSTSPLPPPPPLPVNPTTTNLVSVSSSPHSISSPVSPLQFNPAALDRVEHPSFSVLPPLKSLSVLDIDELAYLDEMAVLIGRSLDKLRELRVGIARHAMGRDWVTVWEGDQVQQVDYHHPTAGSLTIGEKRLGGVLGTLTGFVCDLRKPKISLPDRTTKRRSVNGITFSQPKSPARIPASPPLVVTNPHQAEMASTPEPAGLPPTEITSLRDMFSEVPLADEAAPPSPLPPATPHSTYPAESIFSSGSSAFENEAYVMKCPDPTSTPHPVEEPHEQPPPQTRDLDDHTALEPPASQPDEQPTYLDNTLHLESLELERVPLSVPLLQKAIDWTRLTSLTLLHCPNHEQLWKTLRRAFAPTPRSPTYPHPRRSTPHNTGSATTTPKKAGRSSYAGSDIELEYALQIKKIHTNTVSPALISFLKDSLAPNSLQVLFLQEARGYSSSVSVDQIYKGPLRRHRNSLRKVLIDSSEKGVDGLPTSSSRWRRWLLSREILGFVCSGKMPALRELGAAVDYRDWHFFLQHLPSIPHLRSLSIPFLADHVHGADVDPRELALQIVDIVALRPEVELCYMGIANKCFEILENRRSGDGGVGWCDGSGRPESRLGGVNPMEEEDGVDGAGAGGAGSDADEDEDDEDEGEVGSTAGVVEGDSGHGGVLMETESEDGDSTPDEDEDEESDGEGGGGSDGFGGRNGGAPRLRLREILFYDDKVAIFKARHGRL